MTPYITPHDRIAIASRRFNSRPTKRVAQWQGVPVHVEIEVGDIKSGIDESGNKWSHEYKFPYGELPHSHAISDGDPVDCYLGPNPSSNTVFVVHQLRKNGDFDEDKCMLGFLTAGEAIHAYKSHGPSFGFGSMDTMTADQFRHGYLAANRRHK